MTSFYMTPHDSDRALLDMPQAELQRCAAVCRLMPGVGMQKDGFLEVLSGLHDMRLSGASPDHGTPSAAKGDVGDDWEAL
jgi:hypothetical protein